MTKDLNAYLIENKDSILEKWFEEILKTYSEETARFFRKNEDSFGNPVGNNIYEGLTGIFDCIFENGSSEDLNKYIDKIVRIRAVQDFSPSKAISFILSLKRIIRDETEKEFTYDAQLFQNLLKCENQIDDLMLMSMDIYLGCREKLFEIRVSELKDRNYKLLQKANLIISEQE